MAWCESAAELSRARAEQPLVVPSPNGNLFGLYTPPAPEVPAAGLCVIWFTMPRSHRNRMWVEGARRLAARGFACFRFDYHGVGDSAGEPAEVEPNRPYRDDALAVIRHLRERFGERRFVLYGSCFDARTALSAFDGEADAIEGLFFMAAPVMEMDDLVRADADRKGWSHLLHALRRPDNWRSLRDPGRWKYMATVLGRIGGRTLNAEQRTPLPLSSGFRSHFDRLVRSRAHALFLYGREDREYESFREAERSLWPRLPAEARRRLTIEVWEGQVHDGILRVDRQREIVERVLAWIEVLRARADSLPHAGAATASSPPGNDGARGTRGH